MPPAKSGTDASIVARDARRLSTLLEVSQALSGTLNLKASMQRVLSILVRHHGVRFVTAVSGAIVTTHP